MEYRKDGNEAQNFAIVIKISLKYNDPRPVETKQIIVYRAIVQVFCDYNTSG